MNGTNTDRQRRQTFKKILAGSSILSASAIMPDKWVKPVVDAVLLPAHAQASLITPQLNAAWAGGRGITSIEPRSGEGLTKHLFH